MWSKRTLSIWIFCCMVALASTVPVGVPQYQQVGHTYSPLSNSSEYHVQAKDRQGYAQTTTHAPQFEYALLGQDPEDQHWYRVSLTPTDGKTGYRAQFATRKTPPFDSELAHKHDKTIKELLNFLEKSEEHNLIKVSGQLMSEDQEPKTKRNVNTRDKVEAYNNMEPENNSNNNPRLLLAEGFSETQPSMKRDGSNSTMLKNISYFIKGLK